MIEDVKLSTAILEVIADDESYPARITTDDIRNSNAIKESFKDIDDAKIIFHMKMLEGAGLIDAKFRYKSTLDGATCLVKIIGLTKQGSDYVKYIRSPLWKQAIKSVESSKGSMPFTIQLIYSICDKLIERQNHIDCQ